MRTIGVFVASHPLKSPTRETLRGLRREEDELDDGVRNRERCGNSNRRLPGQRSAVPVSREPAGNDTDADEASREQSAQWPEKA